MVILLVWHAGDVDFESMPGIDNCFGGVWRGCGEWAGGCVVGAGRGRLALGTGCSELRAVARPIPTHLLGAFVPALVRQPVDSHARHYYVDAVGTPV